MVIKVVTTVGVLVALITGVWLFDDRNDLRFAKADDLKSTRVLLAKSLEQLNVSIKKTNNRIDQHTWQDQATYIKRQMQGIRIDCKTNVAYEMPPDARKRYNEYEIELDRLNRAMRGE